VKSARHARDGYLQQLDTADRQEPSEALKTKTSRLKEKIEKLKEQMQRLEILEVKMLATPDQQISLTDPDSRSMATSGRGSGVVGYNVQVAVDTEHHLIVTHEVLVANEPVSCAANAHSRSASAGESFPSSRSLERSIVIFMIAPDPSGSWDHFSFRLRRDPIFAATAVSRLNIHIGFSRRRATLFFCRHAHLFGLVDYKKTELITIARRAGIAG